MSGSAKPAITPEVLDAAADWLARLASGSASAAEHAACERWRRQHPEHARAWAQAEALQALMGQLPPGLTLPVLERARGLSRRGLLRDGAKYGALLAALPAAWAGWRVAQEQGWTAELRSARGEQRHELRLEDGSLLSLNSASAVDLRFDAQQRLLLLRAGEILLDAAGDRRPLRLQTPQGRLELVNGGAGRLVLRLAGALSRVALLDGSLRLEPHRRPVPTLRLRAGEQAAFDAEGWVGPVTPAGPASQAWTRGLLPADRMRLADLAAELSRYRGGLLHCDPAVAELRVSGTFPVGSEAATERTLGMLVSTYALRAERRLGGLWVRLLPA
ncbi:DUF4880 domain-containing protein [Roseateles sp. DAIF2]|uniref:DUF4880 domain-containing protein n=1 Tax=Roseateles sp. DAIF2 TaxID=2714952 RepID=UPI0018A30822|nr:DUF4880 domain-containing protein [Roseateles sp. DAIF2]QPF73257.1 DUF4880 domain-containing protein [Roseateles sp. DAIF2]